MNKNRTLHHSALLFLCIFLFSATLSACGSNEPSVTDNTSTVTVTPGISSSLTPTPCPVVSEPLPSPSATEVPKPTDIPVVTDSEQPTPIPVTDADATPTPVPPTPTQTAREITDDREEYRNLTYLIWLPSFSKGVFETKSSDDTFDYASFSGVSVKDVNEYIEVLKDNGFINASTDDNDGKVIHYTATNADEWTAVVSFDGSTVTIGSGFIDPEAPTSEEETRRMIFGSTILQYLPEFSAGSYAGFNTDPDNELFSYAYFDNVSVEDVIAYISLLREMGYIYGTDEGYSDEIIWYLAMNEDRLSCYVAYDNNLVKIGCGYEE